MSPIKRALDEQTCGGNGAPPEDGAAIAPKRLRGGGGGDDFGMEEEELYDDDDLIIQESGGEPEIPEEVLQEAAAVATALTDKQRWARPEPESDSLTSNKHDLNVQWIDMDVVSGRPLGSNPNRKRSNIVGPKEGRVPILRCFGVSDEGCSATIFIHGFTPYGYFALPPGYVLPDDGNVDSSRRIRNVLNERLKGAARGAAAVPEGTDAVLGVQFIRDHKSIMGYDTPHTQFLKVYVALPQLVPTLKRIMEDGIDLDGIAPGPGAQTSGMSPAYSAFECNIPFVLRYMVDRDIGGAGWLTLPSESYQIRPPSAKETHCQVGSWRIRPCDKFFD